VIATLKLKFALAITLGTAIAEQMKRPAKRYVVPFVESLLPEEYRRWGEVAVYWTIDAASISVAWTLQRIMGAYHSALIGGLMAARNLLEYCSVMGFTPNIKHEDTYLDEVAGYGESTVCVTARN
jgi:hypothetical protein